MRVCASHPPKAPAPGLPPCRLAARYTPPRRAAWAVTTREALALPDTDGEAIRRKVNLAIEKADRIERDDVAISLEAAIATKVFKAHNAAATKALLAAVLKDYA